MGRPPPLKFLPRSTVLLVLSAAVFTVTLIEAVDAFELPYENLVGSLGVGGIFAASVQIEATLGYPGLFALMLLESASLPVPSELVLPLAGYLVSLGKMGFVEAVAVASAGGLVGAYVDYYVGRVVGRPILVRILSKIHISEASLVRAERWFDRGGVAAVLFARFVPLIRTLISFPAGMLKMSKTTFGLATFAGTVGWSALLVYAGYSAGQLWRAGATHMVGLLDSAVVYALLALSSAYIALYFLGWNSSRETGVGL